MVGRQIRFDPFYTATSLNSATDVNVLHEIKGVLDEVGVYEWYEVEDLRLNISTKLMHKN